MYFQSKLSQAMIGGFVKYFSQNKTKMVLKTGVIPDLYNKMMTCIFFLEFIYVGSQNLENIKGSLIPVDKYITAWKSDLNKKSELKDMLSKIKRQKIPFAFRKLSLKRNKRKLGKINKISPKKLFKKRKSLNLIKNKKAFSKFLSRSDYGILFKI